jgi:hypothetical protein
MINEQGKISEIIYIFESTKRSCRHEKHKDWKWKINKQIDYVANGMELKTDCFKLIHGSSYSALHSGK